LIAVWAITGMGYFWPIWVILGWGMGIASHGAAALQKRAAERPRRA
jgi:hypothetical protein